MHNKNVLNVWGVWQIVVNKQMDIQLAILKTIKYADIFSYPLTHTEIYRYLVATPATIQQVQTALIDLQKQGHISIVNGYVCLSGHEAHIQTRQKRAIKSAQLWQSAYRYARRFHRLPFVRMVAVTGSLAMNNVDERADIDYLIVTRVGRLWLCRLLIILLVKWASWRDHITLCPNFIVSENALKFAPQNLFVARELAQMIPLTGIDVYQRICELNTWTTQFLPNAFPSQQNKQPVNIQHNVIKAVIEMCLALPAFGWLDRWEMHRKIRKFTAQNPNSPEADFSPDWCKGHFDGHMRRVLQVYEGSEMEQHHHKVLFGQSYYLRFDPKLWNSMQPYPPLGTLYAAAYARQNGYSVVLFDAMLAESEAEWAAAIERETPTYAVIYEDNFNYLSKMCLTRMRKAAFTMIRMAKDAGCIVIVCGSDATDHYTQYLHNGADYVLIGEGEETLVELLNSLCGRTQTPVNQILGVVTHTHPHPTRRPVIRQLDELPMPAWDLVDVARYKSLWMTHHGYFSMNLVTTRGCPYHCNWCAKPIWGQRYNVHSPQRIVEQLLWLKQHYQPDHIWFADDILGLKPGWLEAYADLIEQHNIRIPFKCLSRADLLLRGDTIHALKRAGCHTVWIGAESGSQKILDAMEKGTRVEQIQQVAQRLHQVGIKVGFFLQFGYPGETRTDIEKTLQLVRDAQPDDIGISVSYPLPGTKFYQRVKNQLGTQQNWQDSNDMAMLYHGPFTTQFYRQLHHVVHKEFRSSRTWYELKQLKFPHPKRVAAMIYHRLTLPLARMRLNQLAMQTPNYTITTLPQGMDYAAAATPTPQGED